MLYGCHLIRFKDIVVKFVKDINSPIIGVLCCNLLTDTELTRSGKIQKQFKPIKILKLSGQKNDVKVISVEQSECYSFNGNSDIKIWIQLLESKKRCELDLNVHIVFKRQ